MKNDLVLQQIMVIKKNGTKEAFNAEKIIIATQKSANRVAKKWNEDEKTALVGYVVKKIEESGITEFNIEIIHSIVEFALERVDSRVANEYRNYRNWKQEGIRILDEMEAVESTVRYQRDVSNANKNSDLVATKRSLIYGEYASRKYIQSQLDVDERQAMKDGYIYIHDLDSKADTWNCCLFNLSAVLKDGFEMGHMWYNEPGTLDTAFDVMGDIILATAAQQYGGFTVPEVDKILLPYAEKSYTKAIDKYINIGLDKDIAEKVAWQDVCRECEQGVQGIEYKLNTVGSSRGDYPFTAFSFGLAEGRMGRMLIKTILEVRKKGQGKAGFKKPVLFPKLIFLYDKNKHGEEMEYEDVFNAAIDCSSKTMYPDYLSLTGKGYVADIYKKYGKVISPMGCRAFLSPWYESGGLNPVDDDDQPIFVGRFNLGVVTLHLPMIYMQAKKEGKDFYELLNFYMDMVRKIHKKTIEYLGNLRASCNPVCFCEGGLYGGKLKPEDKIAKILKPCTVSFGITALNELQQLHNGRSIHEDGYFAKEVMIYINYLVARFKKEDGILYAVYGTPAETLCGKQIQQFRTKYGIIKGVSDREYTTNSFHSPVWEDITAIEKQDDEERFWNLFNGGKIQYCRYPVTYNQKAIKTLVRRAMDIGFYEGVNLALSYCNHCGYQSLDMAECTSCGSRNITAINRMNGYLGFTKLGSVNGDFDFDSTPEMTGRFNQAKTIEISERVSM